MTAWSSEFEGNKTVTLGVSEEPEFTVGCVYGHRAWELDEYSRLRGITFSGTPFKPGVNTAVCGAGESRRRPGGKPLDKHNMLDCSCGYYAYFKGNDSSLRYLGAVTGVVRGTGKVVVAEKGFRAQKAELVALHVPGTVELNRFTRIMRGLLPTISWGSKPEDLEKYGPGMLSYRDALLFPATMIGVFGGVATVMSLAAALSGNAPLALPLTLLAVLAPALFILLDYNTVKLPWRRMKGEPRWGEPENRRAALLTKLYGVPVFGSEKKMLKTFPLTDSSIFDTPEPARPAPDPITPDNTPNFWEL